MDKTITITEEIWSKLTLLKLERKFSTLNDVIKDLLYYQKFKQNRVNICECGNIKYKKSKHCIKCYVNKYNPMWKGDKVGIYALHEWIRKYKPKPEFCEECKIKPPYDVANISQQYKRDINDFRWLCRSCHMKEHRPKGWTPKRWLNRQFNEQKTAEGSNPQ